MSFLEDATRWRRRAKHARALASHTCDAASKRLKLKTAAQYEKLALLADRRRAVLARRTAKARALAEAARKANAELRPILAKSPGFVSYELIKPEGKNDVVASISVFKTRTDAEASNKVAEDWVHTNLPSMTKPRKLAGELVAH